jgi:FkbM family methyltransferase
MKFFFHKTLNIILFSLGPFSSLLRSLISYVYKLSKNLNYDINTNGESYVLDRILSLNINVVFDVGANEGEWAKLVTSKNSFVNVYSFEIVPSTFNKLQDATLNISNINVYNFGLSNKTDNVVINFSKDDDKLSSLIAGSEIHNINWDKIVCKVIKGDEFCDSFKIDTIDFLKIDTEGSENLVIEGLIKKFKNDKIKIVQFEYGMTNIYSKYLLIDYYKYFESMNFKVGKILPNGVDFRDYNPQMEDFFGPNFIAVNKKYYEIISMLSI